MRLMISAIALLLIQAATIPPSKLSNGPMPSTGKTIQEPQNETSDPTQATKPNEKPAQPSAPPELPIINPKTTPQNEKESADVSNKTDDKSSPDWVARFTGLLVFVTFLQLIALVWQIRTSRSTARKELQAYVFPVSAHMYVENSIPKLKMILRNSGKTPALECITEIFEGLGPIIKPLPELPKIDAGKSIRSVSFIPSDGEIWILDDGVVVSAVEADAVRNDRGAVYLIGTITYRDVFKKRHTSRCRFMCSGKNFDAGTFIFCDEGNGIE
jgi:hypothetical protein